MIKLFVDEERGAVLADWVSLTAGILVLGIVVVYSVLGNSAGHLMDEFEDLNRKYEGSSINIASSDRAASSISSQAKRGALSE